MIGDLIGVLVRYCDLKRKNFEREPYHCYHLIASILSLAVYCSGSWYFRKPENIPPTNSLSHLIG